MYNLGERVSPAVNSIEPKATEPRLNMHILHALGVSPTCTVCRRWKHVSGYHPRRTIENQRRNVGAQENVSQANVLAGRSPLQNAVDISRQVERYPRRRADRRYSPATDLLSIDLSYFKFSRFPFRLYEIVPVTKSKRGKTNFTGNSCLRDLIFSTDFSDF